jgi:hypothetical protein
MDATWVERWREDLRVFRDTLPKVHPNPYHATSAGVLRAAIDSLGSMLPLLDHEQATVRLAGIVARIGDGHSRLTLPLDTTSGTFTGHTPTSAPKVPGLTIRDLPIRLVSLSDGFFVSRASPPYASMLGRRVIAMDGLPIDSVVSRVRPVVHGDNEQQVRNLIPEMLVLPAVLRSVGANRHADRVEMTVADDEGATTHTVRASLPGARIEWRDADGKGVSSDRSPHGDVRLWPEAEAVVFRLRDVLEDSDGSIVALSATADSILHSGAAVRFVLDLRGNPGGDSFLGEPIIQLIARNPALWRPGALFTLIDRGSFSAAVNLSAELEKHTPTIFVGEPTGGHPNTWGEARRVVLPNTGLTVRLSTVFWQLTGPTDQRRAITPLLPASASSMDWRGGRDVMLERIYDVAFPRGTSSGRWRGQAGARFLRIPIAVELVESTGGDSGRLEIGAGRELQEVRLDGSRVSFSWSGSEGRWRADGYVAGDRLIGTLLYKGWTFPFVLERMMP